MPVRGQRVSHLFNQLKIQFQSLTAIVLGLGVVLGCGSVPLRAQAPPEPSAQKIIDFLNQNINWYRNTSSEQQLATEPSDLVYLNDDRQLSTQVIRLSFDFARAQADVLAKAPTSGAGQGDNAPNFYRGMLNLVAKSEIQMKQDQQELAKLRMKAETATGAKRRQAELAIAELESEIELLQTRVDLSKNMIDFVSGTNGLNGGTAGLRAQVDELARAVEIAPEKNSAMKGQSEAQPAQTSAAVLGVRKSEPAGILGLINDVIALGKKAKALDVSLRMTESLAQSSKELRAPFRNDLKELMQRGDALSNAPQSNDPALLQQQKKDLDTLTAQFKQRSEVMLPLAKQRVLLDLYKRNLTNWRASVKEQYKGELRALFIRIGALIFVLAVVLGAAEFWRRAIFRYIPDPRRRYQLLLFRRILTWIVTAIVIALAFATELGALATFAGLLTAGVAVALQNVILSVAGYFFLIGKYGVRIGDRVQVAGVTGEVVDIGLVRLHLMEFSDGQPSGRVVVFSNSVVFQPNAGLFKQIPGTDFLWREITLTLAPSIDYRVVEDRLVEAVESIFAEYREKMERQRRILEKTLNPVSTQLIPRSRLRLKQTGLEVVIRYPVELQEAAIIDDRITRALLDEIERDPKLQLVGTGTPNIQPRVAEPAEA